MNDPGKAFHVIVSILRKHNVSFQIAGGLAARVYGSTRKLADIDIYIPFDGFEKILLDVKQHIVFGPGHHKSDLWDLVYLKLDYDGQIIELGDADNTKFRNANTGQWVKEDIDFSTSEIREIFSISVPVMPKDKLLSYKSKLQRDVDKIDLEQIK